MLFKLPLLLFFLKIAEETIWEGERDRGREGNAQLSIKILVLAFLCSFFTFEDRALPFSAFRLLLLFILLRSEERKAGSSPHRALLLTFNENSPQAKYFIFYARNIFNVIFEIKYNNYSSLFQLIN